MAGQKRLASLERQRQIPSFTYAVVGGKKIERFGKKAGVDKDQMAELVLVEELGSRISQYASRRILNAYFPALLVVLTPFSL